MNPYYYDELPAVMDDEAAMAVLFVVLGVLGVVLLFCLIFWIIRSMSLHAIARRRGIRHAWLAWVPVGGSWILGSLADQYQHLAQGKITSRRKILLVLSLAGTALSLGGGIITILQAAMTHSTMPDMAFGFARMGTSLLTWAVGIGSLVFCHICNYDLYRSCDPKNAVVYLVIGIIIPITEPFFYFANRKKDDGMPRQQVEGPFI